MIEFLQKMIFGHIHKWNNFESIMVNDPDKAGHIGKIVVLKCETCGKLKNHKISWD